MAGSGREGRRRGRLSRSGDFDRAYRDGQSHSNRFLVLYTFPRSAEEADDDVRLGVTASRKVGGAVDRNKVKRTLREAFWALADELPAQHDFVLVGRAEIGGLIEREGTAGVQTSIASLLEEARAAS